MDIMKKCSIDECCIEYHEAIAHLSNQEIEELYKKYKRGVTNINLLSEYKIKIPKVNGLITVLPPLCLFDSFCPKCGKSMHRKRDRKDQSSRSYPVKCLDCNYSMPEIKRESTRNPSAYRTRTTSNQPVQQWQPTRDGLNRLQQHGIPESYSLSKLDEFILQASENGNNRNDWNTQFFRYIKKHWVYTQTDAHKKQQRLAEKASSSSNHSQERFQARREEAGPIAQQWQPSLDAQQILQRAGIEPQFIQDSIPEFVLYWQERGDAHKTWNTKFIQHARQQWARYSSSIEHSSVPTRISDDWQPDNDCYDILAMAHIDLQYAQGLIGEFVLYWRDSNQLQTSWNSKFLQYVKQQWARSLSSLEQSSISKDEHKKIADWVPNEEILNSLLKSKIDHDFCLSRIPLFTKYANEKGMKYNQLDKEFTKYVHYGLKLTQGKVKEGDNSFVQVSVPEQEKVKKIENSILQVSVSSSKSDFQSLVEKLEGVIVPTGSLSDGCVFNIELNTSLGIVDANSGILNIINGTKHGLELDYYCEEAKNNKTIFLPYSSIAVVVV